MSVQEFKDKRLSKDVSAFRDHEEDAKAARRRSKTEEALRVGVGEAAQEGDKTDQSGRPPFGQTDKSRALEGLMRSNLHIHGE